MDKLGRFLSEISNAVCGSSSNQTAANYLAKPTVAGSVLGATDPNADSQSVLVNKLVEFLGDSTAVYDLVYSTKGAHRSS
ncbi:MAG: hypothetical protein PV340_01730 [Wolbachia sp.]|nr:hypothetical protein [Wolbachia sp.]MDD9336447.1 hypothetical protein [Wolbachia sp.]